MANANDDDMLVLDARDAAGGVITRQLVDYVHVTTSYSLSVEAEPFLIDSNGNTAWPQQSVAAGDYLPSTSMRRSASRPPVPTRSRLSTRVS